MKNLPPCPVCRTAKKVVAVGSVGDMFKCTRCGGLFDTEPDEGGTHSNWNPAERLEREERNRNKHQLNRRR